MAWWRRKPSAAAGRGVTRRRVKRSAATVLALAATGCGSVASTTGGTSGPAASPVATTTSPADNPGDAGAPCSAVFTLDHDQLRVVVSASAAGELPVEPYVTNGPILRRDIPHVAAGSTTLITFSRVPAVDSISVVLYTTRDTSYSCSVTRRGDPVQQPFHAVPNL